MKKWIKFEIFVEDYLKLWEGDADGIAGWLMGLRNSDFYSTVGVDEMNAEYNYQVDFNEEELMGEAWRQLAKMDQNLYKEVLNLYTSDLKETARTNKLMKEANLKSIVKSGYDVELGKYLVTEYIYNN